MATLLKDKESTRQYAFAAFVEDAHSANELQHVFRVDSLSDSHVASGGIDAAIAWLQKHGRSPQRLLVDISGSDRPLDALDRLADACEPSVEVYALGNRNDVGLFRNLLARGVQDYLVKPLSAELLRRTVLQASGAVRRGRHGKCVAIIGTRGGVGTTAIATQLARALGQGGTRRRVVYLDLNLYDGSGPTMLGCSPGSALLDVLANTDRLDQQYLERALTDVGNGVYALAAELDYAEIFTLAEGALGTLLKALSQYFHYVILDVPQRGGALATEALAHAAQVCLVGEPSVHSARTFARLVRHIGSRPNSPTVLTILNHPQPMSRHRVRDQDFAQAVGLALQVQIPHDPKAPILAENLAQEVVANSDFARGVAHLELLVTGAGSTQGKQRAWWRGLARAGA